MKQRKMPLRKCTGCGEMKEKRELIRVVKAPDTKDENGEIIAKGEISLDLTGRKAGRGAYVCRNLACFEKARKARRFERSLSCKIPDEVYEQAGKLITGADTTIDSIRKNKAKLVIFANDFSKSSKKSVQTAADECNVKTLTMNRSKEEIGFALGKICGVMTTEDKGFADKLEQLIENELGGELYDKI